MQKYDLSLSGGNDNSTFRLSAGYLNQRGIVIKTGMERYTFRANSDFKKGRLKIGENLGLTYGVQDPLSDEGGRSLLEHAIKMAPYLPVYNKDNLGGYQGPTSAIDGQDAENPVRIMEMNSRKRNVLTILGNIYGELELVSRILEFLTTNSSLHTMMITWVAILTNQLLQILLKTRQHIIHSCLPTT
jgi:hypothetical protein